MNALRNLFTGLITALGSTVLVVGALSLALTEGYSFALPTLGPVTEEATQAALPGQNSTPRPATRTAQPVLVTATALLSTSCPAPEGWNAYMVQTGDSILSLTTAYKLTAAQLKEANCLMTDSLLSGTILYLPPVPPTTTPTLIPSATAVPCGPPFGWVRYAVQPDDTLFKLSLLLGVSVPQLQNANCLNSSIIRVGELLWVPFIPRPAPTLTPIPPTLTWTVLPPTDTLPVDTLVPSETPSPTLEPSITPSLLPTTGTPVVESAPSGTPVPPSNTAAP
jgi:LysM repeat protein